MISIYRDLNKDDGGHKEEMMDMNVYLGCTGFNETET